MGLDGRSFSHKECPTGGVSIGAVRKVPSAFISMEKTSVYRIGNCGRNQGWITDRAYWAHIQGFWPLGGP